MLSACPSSPNAPSHTAPACHGIPPGFCHSPAHCSAVAVRGPVAARLGRPRTALCGATRGVPKTGLAARVVGGNADVLGRVLLAHWYHGAFWLHCGAFERVLFC